MASQATVGIALAGARVMPPSGVTATPANLTLRTAADFIEAAHQLTPVVAEYAQRAEDLRMLPDDAVLALLESGVLESLRPKMFGGPELDFNVAMTVSSILARGCSATGWLAMVYSLHFWFISMLPRRGQEEIFGSGRAVLSPGVFNTVGAKFRAAPGGYLLSGSWQFASGAVHSNWACLSARAEASKDAAPPDARQFVVPRSDYSVVDTWRTMGLRGTGSADILIEDEIFVPEWRANPVEDLLNGSSVGGRLHPGAAYRLPCVAAFNVAAAAPAIGIAWSALELFKDRVRNRVRAFTEAKHIEDGAALSRIGRASIELEAAALLLDKAVCDLEDRVRAGGEVSAEMKSRMRMTSAYVSNVCKSIATSLVEASGARAMFVGSAIGQALRDLTMLCTHHTLDYDGGPENYGRVLLGLEPSNHMI